MSRFFKSNMEKNIRKTDVFALPMVKYKKELTSNSVGIKTKNNRRFVFIFRYITRKHRFFQQLQSVPYKDYKLGRNTHRHQCKIRLQMGLQKHDRTRMSTMSQIVFCRMLGRRS